MDSPRRPSRKLERKINYCATKIVTRTGIIRLTSGSLLLLAGHDDGAAVVVALLVVLAMRSITEEKIKKNKMTSTNQRN